MGCEEVKWAQDNSLYLEVRLSKYEKDQKEIERRRLKMQYIRKEAIGRKKKKKTSFNQNTEMLESALDRGKLFSSNTKKKESQRRYIWIVVVVQQLTRI